MKLSYKLVAITMAGLMATTAMTPVFAASDTATAPGNTVAPTAKPAADTKAASDSTAAAVPYEIQAEMLRTADEALTAITRAHAARLALFENDTAAASKLVTEGIDALGKSETDLDQLLIADTGMAGADKAYLPFDMAMSLTETFAPTDANKAALEKASGLIQSKKADEAVQVLRLADIQVNIETAMLPAAQTMDRFKAASGFVAEGKFFEANLALKEIEDSVVVRTFGIDAIPEQGAK